jgi:hypothetical protein
MDGTLVPYKDPEIRRQKARAYTAAYRARVKEVLTEAEPRSCLHCGIDIRHKRSDAKFCSREHKKKYFDSHRDYKKVYEKHSANRRKLALKYYYADVEESRRKKAERQKTNPALFAAHTAKRRAARLVRTPKWLTKQDFANIRKVYALAAELSKAYGFKWHVDHIAPLQGKNISGLHVADNLQVIPANLNIAKSNRFEAA